MTKQPTIDIGDINIGDHCTHCGIDTSFKAGNGMFVNRIPSGADAKLVLAGGEKIFLSEATINVTVDGYMCVNCQLNKCERCGEFGWWMVDDLQSGVCLDCLDKEDQQSTME